MTNQFPFINLNNLIVVLLQNWSRTSLISKIKNLAERRKLEDLTVGPVLTVSVLLLLLFLIILFIWSSKIPLMKHPINSILTTILDDLKSAFWSSNIWTDRFFGLQSRSPWRSHLMVLPWCVHDVEEIGFWNTGLNLKSGLWVKPVEQGA